MPGGVGVVFSCVILFPYRKVIFFDNCTPEILSFLFSLYTFEHALLISDKDGFETSFDHFPTLKVKAKSNFYYANVSDADSINNFV